MIFNIELIIGPKTAVDKAYPINNKPVAVFSGIHKGQAEITQLYPIPTMIP